jgi:hypothetical protein
MGWLRRGAGRRTPGLGAADWTPSGLDDGGPFKIGMLGEPDGPPCRLVRPDVWQREHTSGPERLRIGCRRGAIDVMLALAGARAESWRLLYVLLVSRGRGREGRHESPVLSWAQASEFLRRHRDVFELDARHAIWLQGSGDDAPLFVLEQHDVLYAYGALDEYESVLGARGFRRGPVEIPAPHTHHYHSRLDADVEALLGELPWRWTPLLPYDEAG